MEKWIQAFVRRAQGEGLPVEGIAAYQGGRLVAQRRFTPDTPRNIYSHTKAFTSTAVGMAIADGLLSLDDTPAAFFPEALPQDASAALQSITLRHLLTMSSGFNRQLMMSPSRRMGVGAPDFAKFILSQPVRQPPGVKFKYSHGDSYLAGRMVEKKTGQTMRDYLNERLFIPLGIPYPEWEHCPLGHTFGASGLSLRTEDMAKLGLLYLQNGVWEGKQLLDPTWVREATSLQIHSPDISEDGWYAGYGYQFWMSPHAGAYRAEGIHGQMSCVHPAADAVVAIQCAESDRAEDVAKALREEVLERL